MPIRGAAHTQLRRVFPWLCLSAGLLSFVALVNGFPLVFPDTGTYLRQAMRLEGILDRPPFYSMFLVPLHLGRSLWPIPFVQDLIVAAVLFRSFSIAFPGLGPRRMTAAVAACCLFTTLPFYADQIMPDIYTPLIVLLVFCLVLGWTKLSWPERIAGAAGLLAMQSFHSSNPLFSVAIAVAAALLAWRRGDGSRTVLRRAGLVPALACLALAGQTLYGYATIGRITPAPAAPFFTLARLIYDGPAKQYLADVCPGAGFVLCSYQQDFSGNSDTFLWQPNAPLAALKAARGEIGALDEASAIVSGTLRRYPTEVAAAAARNAARQFFSVATRITDCPCLGGKIGHVIPELFPGEAKQYGASLQNRGEIPWPILTRIDLVALIASGAALGFVLLRAPAWLSGEAGRLLALITWALVVNATLMGMLSGVTDRYQARLIWLVPFFAMAVLLDRVRPAPQSRLEFKHPLHSAA
jgi:hypothetical protein